MLHKTGSFFRCMRHLWMNGLDCDSTCRLLLSAKRYCCFQSSRHFVSLLSSFTVTHPCKLHAYLLRVRLPVRGWRGHLPDCLAGSAAVTGPAADIDDTFPFVDVVLAHLLIVDLWLADWFVPWTVSAVGTSGTVAVGRSISTFYSLRASSGG